jgi:hypothetical protein
VKLNKMSVKFCFLFHDRIMKFGLKTREGAENSNKSSLNYLVMIKGQSLLGDYAINLLHSLTSVSVSH